jgi:hypothetical protein
MENQFSLPTSALKKGLAVIVGEIVFGVNGPFFFERFGLNVPLAITSGVLVGAAVGYCVAALVLSMSHRERAIAKHAPNLSVNAPLR